MPGILDAPFHGCQAYTRLCFHICLLDHQPRTVQGIVRSGLREGLPSRRCMAIHEAGRALTATLLRQQALQAGAMPKLEAVERVSIIPRGRSAPLQA